MSMITKTVKGKQYEYFQYLENGKPVQKYCGPAGSDRAKKAYLDMEYEHLKSKKRNIDDKIHVNRDSVKKIKKQRD